MAGRATTGGIREGIRPADLERTIEAIVAGLQQRRVALSDEMVEAIRTEILAYDPIGADVVEDVREHCEAHAAVLLEVAGDGRLPRREELEFARRAAARRVRQGVPIDGLLQAFRIGHRVVWDAILRESQATPAGREAAIALARPAMEYIDVASTQVAEAYLKEEQRLMATADRERRDLLENLLAGSPPGPEQLPHPIAPGLSAEGPMLVFVARPGESPQLDGHVLQHAADALAARISADALVVARQGEVVGIIPLAGYGEAPEAARSLRAARAHLAERRGMSFTIGSGNVCVGFAGIARGYHEAHHARARAGEGRGVVALSELSPFEYLTASVDDGAWQVVAQKGRRLLEADEREHGAVGDTLLAYVECDLNAGRAAQRLVVHPNTVRYRLRRIAELTGRDPRRFEDLLELVTVIRMARSRPSAAPRAREPS